jgi:glucosamine kinase
MTHYLIGVDGGGTGTRVRLAQCDGTELAQGRAGPSGLALGISNAWVSVHEAITQAFTAAGLELPPRSAMHLGLGLAGVNVRSWAAKFIAANPGYASATVDTDAYTTLLGAHRGQPGAIVAVGTGSVGLALGPDGLRREVGGWGFPTGDEASGGWLGQRAVNHLEQVVDGRVPASEFSAALWQACGGTRESLFNWVIGANQTRFAQIAPLVLAHAETDVVAQRLMTEAALQVARMANALDPQHELPLSLCGGLSHALLPWLPADLRQRVTPPQGDSAWGALHMVRDALKNA